LDVSVQRVLRPNQSVELPEQQPKATQPSPVAAAPPPQHKFNVQVLDAEEKTPQKQPSPVEPRSEAADGVLENLESTGLGGDSLVRVMKAKLRGLNERLENQTRAKDTWKSRCAEATASRRKAEEEVQKLQKQLQRAHETAERNRKTRTRDRGKEDELSRELATLRGEAAAAARSAKQAESIVRATEVRLTRALEDNKRYKELLKNAKAGSGEELAHLRQTNAAQANQIKALERQRTELLAALKKQIRLIDILRRQKVHIEAAKALSFTEEEFMSALDWIS